MTTSDPRTDPPADPALDPQADPPTAPADAAPRPTDDPGLPAVPAWLDEITGERALAWVEEHNARTRAAYEGQESFESTRAALEEIMDSPDRIPAVGQTAGLLYNLWTDAEHPRGLWRRTAWESYRAGSPDAGGSTQWEELLDLDALGAAEGVAWVWHGAQVLRTGALAGRRALVELSEGGSDTDITREFDLEERRFVPAAEGGFIREASKGSLSWADDEGDMVLSVAEVGPGSLSPAGYPRQVRRLRRGAAPEEAEILLTAAPGDDVAWAHRDRWGRTWLLTHPDFHTEELWLLPDGAPTLPVSRCADCLASPVTVAAPGAVHIDVPASAQAFGAWDQLLISLREDWAPEGDGAGTTYPAGSLLAIDLEAFLAGSRAMEVLFLPTPSASLIGWATTAHHLVLTILDDCVTVLEVLTPAASSPGWSRRPLDLRPLTQKWDDDAGGQETEGATTDADTAAGLFDPTLLRPGRPLLEVSASAVDARVDDRMWLTCSSFTRPTTLAVGVLDAEGALGGVEVLRRTPERFDARGIEATQHVAVSADGTRVPYFQVGRPSRDAQGRTVPAPTILYGYGGFEVPLGVGYLPVTGKAWLERGGTYVIANTRGGGEYGPAWHRAGLKEGRHRVYEDFAAVARALVDRGVTTRSGLAVHGGSNGGLLVGNMLTTYPELVGAVLCEVPLLDMSRYTHLLAGASWEAEYGDPDDPEQWALIRTFSPFHLLERGQRYPPTLLVTSTRDDRVHPAHARTMAHRLEALGQPVTYFENSEGGHGAASTNAQRAWMSALRHEFAWRTLRP
ncbi:MAG: prolyl oligopeptidase family serine peptidase [Actinomyces sp.]|uniref:prolyl oligopeptidase family serine peptidase n=1 Tax=Actinomyces sp. TaxID=29317 RepID=UPI0026DAF36B|nr:prolyl oligopeptidase family serine peptidase [Actinomyces sp.]MDO4244020.1 prolyl oligopeptidase family serine peptidase [Actinomyces sp.]